MHSISAERVDELLPGLLDEIARGETVTITRNGVPVATIAPARDQARVHEAVEGLRQLRGQISRRLEAEGQPPITIEEALSWRDEGRRWL